MKRYFLVLFGLWFGTTTLGLARPAKPEIKGVELYSWNEGGKWQFVLVSGTNRLKTEAEVKGSPNRLDTVVGLRGRFFDLAEGETVTWNFHFVPGLAFPEKKTFDEVIAAARSAQVVLSPDRNEKR